MMKNENVVPIPVQKILVNSTQAAELFSISVRTIGSLTASGKLPVVKIGSSTRYRVRDLYIFAHDNLKGGV